MSDIVVNVTNAGAANVAVSNGSTVNAVVGSGGSVNVALGSISPGNATVVSGTLTINSTTTLAAGAPAYVVNNGTAYAAKLDIGIPSGPATNVTVGKVSTLSAGSNATVTGTANGSTLTLDFGIPAGASGSNGTNGTTPSFSIGKVSTLAAGSSANVTLTTANSGANVTLNFGIPAGADGNGSVSLSNATPSNLGTASAGSSNLAARADHVHSLPVISYANLTGVPTNFPTNATLVSGLSSATVSSVNNLAGSLTLAAGENVTLTQNGSTLTLLSSGGGIDANGTLDGGFYVGENAPTSPPVITITQQPQNTTATQSGFMSTAFSLPSGRWAGVTRAGGKWFATPSNADSGGDYIATSDDGITWTKTNLAFATAAYWGKPIYHNGVWLSIRSANFLSSGGYATSTNGTAWTERAFPFNTSGAVVVDGVGFVIASSSGLANAGAVRSSNDGVTWQSAGPSGGVGDNVWHMASDGGRLVLIAGSFIGWSAASGSSLGSWSFQEIKEVIWNGSQYVEEPVDLINFRCVFGGSRAVLWRLNYPYGFYTDLSAQPTSGNEQWSRSNHGKTVKSVAWAGSRFVFAVDDVTDSGIWTSSTGQSLVLRDAAARVSVAAVSSHVVAISAAGAAAYSSDGGITWESKTLNVGASETAARLTGLGDVILAETNMDDTAEGGSIIDPDGSAVASFNVAASVSPVVVLGYQWQRSDDAGTTFGNVSGATSATLSLSSLTSASDDGDRYRVLVSATGATSVTSNAATLTVS